MMQIKWLLVFLVWAGAACSAPPATEAAAAIARLEIVTLELTGKRLIENA